MVSLPNLVRGLVLLSAGLMLVGHVGGSMFPTVLGLGLIVSLPWIMLVYYTMGMGSRYFAASVAVSLFFPLYVLLLSHGLLP